MSVFWSLFDSCEPENPLMKTLAPQPFSPLDKRACASSIDTRSRPIGFFLCRHFSNTAHLPRLFGFALVWFSIAVSGAVHAQNVTWSAQGLPPGIKLQTINGGNARFTGTPTKAGIYNVIVYPMVKGVAGDMIVYRLNVLPKNVNLPLYYKYTRAISLGWLETLAGGGGAVWVKDDRGVVSFTTNGVNFKAVSLPASFKGGKWSWNAAVISSQGRFLLLRKPNGYLDNVEMVYSDTQGAIKSLNAPQDVSKYSLAMSSNGVDRFFLISLNDNYSTSPSSKTFQIFTLSGNQTSWSMSSSIPTTTQKNLNSASIAANGNTLVMALSGYNDPISVLRSIDNGNSWSIIPKAPELIRVAFGNGIFLGTTNDGVFKSADGITWTRVSRDYHGQIIFSAKENLFFTSSSVTKDGVVWLDYENSWSGVSNSSVVASSGSGVVFLDRYQLSSTYIPTYYYDSRRVAQGNVGKRFVEEITLD